MINKHNTVQIAETGMANSRITIYEAEINDKKIEFMNSYVSAPGCIGMLDGLFAIGMKN